MVYLTSINYKWLQSVDLAFVKAVLVVNKEFFIVPRRNNLVCLRQKLKLLQIGSQNRSIIQLALVISTSVISNNCLSRRENLVLVLTQKSKIRLQNIVENRRNCSWGAISLLFHNIFNVYF